ncbi:MAG TPA: protein kinase [Pyrinomonadaceae bacterium]|nr:protein kinase [Pyrinomonadaceae bacterium]
MKPLAPNTLIQNRYLVVQLIGKGGMGDVYLAVDQRLGSAIALKRTFFSDDVVLREAFEREAKMLARLRHSVLPKVSDHFTESDVQYLVMEHISGDDLSNRLEQNHKPFPVSWVLFWADQLLDALSYLHSHEPPIIHRDIKPQNLKLTTENHIILLDFGLAKNSVGETRLSTTGNVIAYTPNYASMEQIRGTGTTSRSDIYSLSATMYQLLTCIVPADALTRADAVLNNLADPIKPLTELNPEVSPAVWEVIKRGLSLSAEQRFATARDMQIALREANSQVQTAMSAQTVAFNVEEELKQADTVRPQSDIKTVAFTAPINSEPVGEKTEVMPLDLVQSTMDNVPVVTEQPNHFDATVASVPLPSEAATEITPVEIPTPLVGEKTEVMPFVLPTPVGEKTEVMPIEVSAPYQEVATPPQEVAATPYQDEIDTKQTGDFSPEATVPLIAYNGQVSEAPVQEVSNFAAIPPVESKPVSQEPIAEQKQPEPKKKAAGGGGKMLLILGLLFGLGVLALAAVGGGLYVFKPELLGLATPTPVPTATATPVPSVTPSPEPTLEANNNSNSNTPTDLANTNGGNSNTTTTEKTPDVVTEKTPDERPGFPTPGKGATPTPTRVVTQTTPGKTPPAKTPPKTPTSKTPSRTDILQ